MSSYKCILLVYVKKFSSGNYRIFYRRETVICMGLFDSMKDNMERRQRTREYLKNAKEYINDGEELYQNAYEKVLKRADKTRDAIRKHVEYKKDISRRLGEEILPTIENFQVPDFTTKIDPPFIDGKKAGLTTFSNSFASAVCMNPVPIPSIMDLFVSEEDYLEARNQRDEAKQFKQQMKYERERLYEYKDRMSMITSVISEEHNQIDALMEKLDTMTGKMKSFEKSGNHSTKEIEYMKAIKKISEAVCKLLSADFLNDNLEISDHYKNIMEGIEQINCAIPSANNITDSQIKKIENINIGW